jgi:hypothetical protein
MGKRMFSILGTVGLVTGLVLGTGVRSASAAGEDYRSPVTSAGYDDGARHDSYWQYYGCFNDPRVAEDVCCHLRREGFRCKTEYRNRRWHVYTHRDR